MSTFRFRSEPRRQLPYTVDAQTLYADGSRSQYLDATFKYADTAYECVVVVVHVVRGRRSLHISPMPSVSPLGYSYFYFRY